MKILLAIRLWVWLLAIPVSVSIYRVINWIVSAPGTYQTSQLLITFLILVLSLYVLLKALAGGLIFKAVEQPANVKKPNKSKSTLIYGTVLPEAVRDRIRFKYLVDDVVQDELDYEGYMALLAMLNIDPSSSCARVFESGIPVDCPTQSHRVERTAPNDDEISYLLNKTNQYQIIHPADVARTSS